MKELNWMGKKVGYYQGRVFVTYRNDSQILKRFNSFGISEEVLKILRDLNISTIVIKYNGKDGKIKYVTCLKAFEDSQAEFDDEGDRQKHLSLEEMTAVTDE